MKDLLAASASGLCILHCLLTPLLLMLGAAGAMSAILSSEWVHYLLLVPVLLLAALSLPAGKRRHHNNAPSLLALVGIVLLLLALVAPVALESTLSVSAGLLLIAAHLYNRQLCKRVAHLHNQPASC